MKKANIYKPQYRDYDYLEWLKGYKTNLDPDNTYNLLFRDIHKRLFVSFIDYDINRVYEALELRNEYINEGNLDPALPENEITMLELIISLADRCVSLGYQDVDERSIYDWFWTLLKNVGLNLMTDELYDAFGGSTVVDDTLERIINRTYKRNGLFGFFPLKYTRKDQRKIELWYQMNEYIEENC